MLKLIVALMCFVSVFCVGLFLVQHRLLYPNPQPYSPATLSSVGSRFVFLEYPTAEGRQRAFYSPSKAARLEKHASILPDRIWLLFAGIGMLALAWDDFVQRFPDPNTAFVLIDYPGFGASQGKASPDSTHDSAAGAVFQLARHLRVSQEAISSRLNVLGTSFGTGAAALFAAHYPVNKVVLVSPYSSLLDAACYRWRKPLCYLLRYHYDTEEELSELILRRVPPKIYILHGDKDQTLPVEMARKLAQISPLHINYQEFHGEGHEILFSREKEIFAAMME